MDVVDKVNVSQVCPKWKRIVYRKSMWRGCKLDIRGSADLEIVAPSFKERGVKKVALHESWLIETMKWRHCSTIIFMPSSAILAHHLSHLTRAMADSLVSLDCFGIKIPVGKREMRKVFNVAMPNLESLILGQNFHVNLQLITKNCSNLKMLGIHDCSLFNNSDTSTLLYLRKLSHLSVSVPLHETITDIGFRNIRTQLPDLRTLAISCSGKKLSVLNIVHIAHLRHLHRLELRECELPPVFVDILSTLQSLVQELSLDVMNPDDVMEEIGRSQLKITHLAIRTMCFGTTDNGIKGLLKNGHKQYKYLQIEGESTISKKWMIRLANRLNDLETLIVDGEDKLQYAKMEAAKKAERKAAKRAAKKEAKK